MMAKKKEPVSEKLAIVEVIVLVVFLCFKFNDTRLLYCICLFSTCVYIPRSVHLFLTGFFPKHITSFPMPVKVFENNLCERLNAFFKRKFALKQGQKI